VGGGVGARVGRGVGTGVAGAIGVPVGLGVAAGVAGGPSVAVAIAGDEASGSLGIGSVAVGACGTSGGDSAGTPAIPTAGVGDVDWPMGRFAPAVAGVPVAPATAPPNRGEYQIAIARIDAATATIPRATDARRSLRRGIGVPVSRGAAGAVALAIETPHPGHAPPPRLQHLSQA
jgi:hypothetical protein